MTGTVREVDRSKFSRWGVKACRGVSENTKFWNQQAVFYIIFILLLLSCNINHDYFYYLVLLSLLLFDFM